MAVWGPDSDAYGSLRMVQSDPSSQTALSEKTQLRGHELVKLLADQSLCTWLLTEKPDLSINELHTDRRQGLCKSRWRGLDVQKPDVR